MSEANNAEFDLDQLSEAETDEEFGLPEFREHFADTLAPAVLKDWTAKDFASIYVRFRPHLERHARRFLVNPSQVEEVVQDSFLYLMTSLPELDSELGVLKFLKWKARLLALDVNRSAYRFTTSIDHLPEMESDEQEASLGLERADDVAVVSLALARLQPRQREALIATLYEEKSQEEVARQMGLSENAFRQLLFRARSSFKRALLGEADVSGLSISEILSVAARKASRDARKGSSIVGAVALLLVGGASIPAVFESNPPNPVEVSVAIFGERDQLMAQRLNGHGLTPKKSSADSTPEVAPLAFSVPPLAPEPDITSIQVSQVSFEQDPEESPETPKISDGNPDNSSAALTDFLNGALVVDLASNGGAFFGSDENGLLTIDSENGLSASLGLDLTSESIVQFAHFRLRLDAIELTAVPTSSLVVVERLEDEKISAVSFAATDFLVGDFTGAFGFSTASDNLFSRSAIIVEIAYDKSGETESVNLRVIPRV